MERQLRNKHIFNSISTVLTVNLTHDERGSAVEIKCSP